MHDIKSYEIPDNVRTIEFGADIFEFQNLKKSIPKSRLNESKYFRLLSAMIFLEEAFHSRRVQKFDLQIVQLQLNSKKNKIFTIGYDVSMHMIKN